MRVVCQEFAFLGLSTNAWLALFTLALVIVAILQLRLFRKQANWMRQSERAWLIIDNPTSSPANWPIPPKGTIPAENICIKYELRNCGHSPAKIVRGYEFYTLVKNLSELPSNPVDNYSNKNICWNPYGYYPIKPDGVFSRVAYLQSMIPGNLPYDFQDLSQGTKFLVFFGAVQYLDIFNTIHESRFCMVAPRNCTILDYGGPPSYNELT